MDQMPTLSAEHMTLLSLIGVWEGQERMYPSPLVPEGSIARGIVCNARALDGFAVVQDYEQWTGEKVTFRGHGVFRYDSEAAQHELHWHDSLGFAPSRFVGSFRNGVLKLTMLNPQFNMRARWDVSVVNAISYLSEVSPDGHEWTPFMEGSYTRAE